MCTGNMYVKHNKTFYTTFGKGRNYLSRTGDSIQWTTYIFITEIAFFYNIVFIQFVRIHLSYIIINAAGIIIKLYIIVYNIPTQWSLQQLLPKSSYFSYICLFIKQLYLHVLKLK